MFSETNGFYKEDRTAFSLPQVSAVPMDMVLGGHCVTGHLSVWALPASPPRSPQHLLAAPPTGADEPHQLSAWMLKPTRQEAGGKGSRCFSASASVRPSKHKRRISQIGYLRADICSARIMTAGQEDKNTIGTR